MSSLNKAIIIGRLGADPEVRYTQSNIAVASMSVATSEKYTDKATGESVEKTEWHRVVVWARLAEICQQYLRKGSLVYFEGQLQTRKWQDKEGIDRYITEIKAFTMQMLDSKHKEESNSGKNHVPDAPQPVRASPPAKSTQQVLRVESTEDDDLPF